MASNDSPSVTLNDLQNWLKPIGSLQLEADTAMRVVAFLCKENGINHRACRGKVKFKGDVRHHEHFLVDIGHRAVVDFNLNMFMGSRLGSPRGVIFLNDYPGLEYSFERESVIGIDELSFGIYTGIPAAAYPPALHFAKNSH